VAFLPRLFLWNKICIAVSFSRETSAQPQAPLTTDPPKDGFAVANLRPRFLLPTSYFLLPNF